MFALLEHSKFFVASLCSMLILPRLMEKKEMPTSAELHHALVDAMQEADEMDDDVYTSIAHYFLSRAALGEMLQPVEGAPDEDPDKAPDEDLDKDNEFFQQIVGLFQQSCQRLQRVPRHINPLLQESENEEFIKTAEIARSALYRCMYSSSAD